MPRIVFLCTLLIIAGCAPIQPDKTLYQRLGGDAGVEAIVYQLIVYIADDERVVERFRGVDIERFRDGLETYVCSVANGNCRYTGDSMQVVHAGHEYTDTEFNAIVENLIRAMDKRQVPTPAQNELLARLAPDYKDIVYQ